MGWNLAAMSKEDKKAAETLCKELGRQIVCLDEECAGHEVDQEAEWCQETLSKVLDAKGKKMIICARSKRWWNSEKRERGTASGREMRRGRRSEAGAHTKAELQRSIRQSKCQMLKVFLQNLAGCDVGWAAKFGCRRVGATMLVLTN